MNLELLSKLSSDSNEYKKWNEAQKLYNERLENMIEGRMDIWKDRVSPLINRLRTCSPDMLPDFQAEVLSIRQQINEELSTWMTKIAKLMLDIDIAKKERWMFYATGFGLKTNMAEKTILFDGELGVLNQRNQFMQIYLEHLKETRSTVDNINWAIKNKIEIINALA